MECHKGGLKRYWKQRAYGRLDGAGGRRVRNKVELGGGRRRRFWRVKISPKFRFVRLLSPRRLLARIRDAYVRMMLAFASNPALMGYGGDVFDGFQAPVKEYDERVILQIYKSLVATTGAGGPAAAGEISLHR
ncbi:hypothetical protein HPP92_006902 [Vanilla planifolia]|uniref:Uncharacterized protein n=1 Tax=Vanilla planifolia TaxID=51239 RepID=A0A835R961_VANPL|nr:hypothetical protein HPP92_006902 [Vanilla planifolia]